MSASLALAALAAGAAPIAAPAPDRFPASALATACAGKDGWSEPAPPAHLFGNTWYVGTCGIAALLVTTPRGDVLVDAGPPEAAPLVAANLARLGVSLHDIRWIVGSHEHYDHAGAIAELKRRSGARLAGTAAYLRVLARGVPDGADPQRDSLSSHPMEPVRGERVLPSGGSIAIGGTVLTATATPAHSPGSTSWTWRTCEGKTCSTITYADSATVISADAYRFTAHPERIAQARIGIERIGRLPCGILVTPHPAASDLFARMRQGLRVDPAACRAYAVAARARFDARLASEQAAPAEPRR